MKRASIFRLSLALVLIAALAILCGTASASSEALTGEWTGLAIASSSQQSENVSASSDTMYPTRGAVVDLWWWYDSTDGYNMQNGKSLNYFSYTLYGSNSVTVTKGGSWLALRGSVWNWEWVLKKNNTTSKTREGQIVVRDSRGLVLTINIHQAGMPVVKSVTNKKGINTLKVKRFRGVDGFEIRCERTNAAGRTSYTRVGRKALATSYSISVKNGSLYTYYVRPYVKLGSKTIYGPSSNYVSVDTRD